MPFDPMPDRHWAVLRNRGATAAPEIRSGATEMLAGLGSYTAARCHAARLARDGFAHGATTDRRHGHVPRLAPLRLPAARSDACGDRKRLGAVITTARLAR
jgi:hypothetical protein